MLLLPIGTKLKALKQTDKILDQLHDSVNCENDQSEEDKTEESPLAGIPVLIEPAGRAIYLPFHIYMGTKSKTRPDD